MGTHPCFDGLVYSSEKMHFNIQHKQENKEQWATPERTTEMNAGIRGWQLRLGQM